MLARTPSPSSTSTVRQLVSPQDERVFTLKDDAAMAKEFPTIKALTGFLAPMLPENQDYLLNKLNVSLLIKLLMADGNLLANILALIDGLDTSKKSGSLNALDTLKKIIITNQQVSLPSSEITKILVSAETPARKLKLLYLLIGTDSLQLIEAYETIAFYQLNLLHHVDNTLATSPADWANAINLPTYLLNLPPQMILARLKELNTHDALGKCFATQNFSNALNQKLKQGAEISLYSSILQYCITAIKDQKQRNESLSAVLLNIITLDGKILSACLKLVSNDIAKLHVWKTPDFNINFLMANVEDLNDINWNLACSILTGDMIVDLIADPRFFEKLPTNDHLKFVYQFNKIIINKNGECFINAYSKTFQNLALPALLFVAICCDAYSARDLQLTNYPTALRYLNPYVSRKIRPMFEKLRLKLLETNSPSITSIVCAQVLKSSARLTIREEDAYTRITDVGSVIFKHLAYELNAQFVYINRKYFFNKNDFGKDLEHLEQVVSLSKHAQAINDQSSVSILIEVIHRLKLEAANITKDNPKKIIELILFLEDKIEELNAHYEAQRSMLHIPKNPDMYQLAYGHKPKMLALRYVSNSLVRYLSLEKTCGELLEALLARKPRVTPSSTAAAELIDDEDKNSKSTGAAAGAGTTSFFSSWWKKTPSAKAPSAPIVAEAEIIYAKASAPAAEKSSQDQHSSNHEIQIGTLIPEENTNSSAPSNITAEFPEASALPVFPVVPTHSVAAMSIFSGSNTDDRVQSDQRQPASASDAMI